MRRKIVKINEDLCNGCGQCVHACAEGAIRLIEGKARLVSETYCDGLGACLGECPQDAITIEEREANAFDEKAVHEHLRSLHAEKGAGAGCPGAQARVLGPVRQVGQVSPLRPGSSEETGRPSALRQWPVQLHLLSPQAPYFQDCDLLIAADCVAFSMGDFHERLLEGHSVAIACPKLDDTTPYLQKLTALFSRNTIRSITVAIMEVPCCRGLEFMVEQALKASGKNIPLTIEVISLDGRVKSSESRGAAERVCAEG